MERRYSRGLYLLNSFTYSRARDNASGHLEVQNGDNSRVNYRDIEAEFGRSGYDQPLNNTTSFVWELPFGKGRKFGDEPEPGDRRRPRRMARRRHQHDDERRADQSVLLAVGDVQRQRQSDLSTEPDRRPAHAETAHDQQLPESAPRWRSRPTGRSRSATRRATSPRPVRSTSSISACTRRSGSAGINPPRGTHRGVQPAQQNELRSAEREPIVELVRDDYLDVSRPADSARSEVLLLAPGREGGTSSPSRHHSDRPLHAVIVSSATDTDYTEKYRKDTDPDCTPKAGILRFAQVSEPAACRRCLPAVLSCPR